jgi:hypothetical protein
MKSAAHTVGRQGRRRRKRTPALTGSRSEPHVSALHVNDGQTATSGGRLDRSVSPRISDDAAVWSSLSDSFDCPPVRENAMIVPLGENQLAALAVAELKDTFSHSGADRKARKRLSKQRKRQMESDRKATKREKVNRAERDKAERRAHKEQQRRADRLSQRKVDTMLQRKVAHRK